MGSSAREHKQRAAERARYAAEQLRATRADPSQRNAGGTRASRRAEHYDRANDRPPEPNPNEPNREGAP